MNLSLKGKLVSGKGTGARFVSLPIYDAIFAKHFENKIYHGTLNLELQPEYIEILDQKFETCLTYPSMTYNGKTYGGIKIIKIKIKYQNTNTIGLAVRPLKSTHNPNIIEIVSDINFRDTLNIKNGDILEFEL